jgi:hypothetical protein
VLTAVGAAATGVMVALPLCPSLVAVMVADPVATAVTSPEPFTDATPAALDVHVIARPVTTAPAASRKVAVNCCVCPTVGAAVVGVTATVATGAGGAAGTVMVAVPVRPSLVAVIVAVPAATAVTSPLPETVAIALALVLQLTVRPESTEPPASRSVAVSCWV